jgi:hypothetical protein
MQRGVTNPIARSLAFALACFASLLIAACGGGGGGGSSNGSSSSGKATLRFFQAGAVQGTAQFTVQGNTTSLAFREISAGVSVDAGTMTITAVAPGTTIAVTPLTITLNEGETGVVVLNQSETVLPRLTLAGNLGGGTGNTVAYANYTPYQPILDVYVLSGGQTLDSATAVSTGLRTNETSAFATVAGTYQVVATVSGRKDHVVYQSGNLTPAGSPTVLLGAQWTFESLQPLPISVSRSGTATVDDSRPLVRVLQPYFPSILHPDLNGEYPSLKLFVDCDQPVVALPYKMPPGPMYRISPGTRSIAPGVFSSTTICPLEDQPTAEVRILVEADKNYIQPFGPSRVVPTSLEIQSYGWTIPRVNADFPVPANRARLRIVTNNSLRPGDVYVNGALVKANMGIEELVVDVNPGNVRVEQFVPGSTTRTEGAVVGTVLAGRFYLIEIGHFATAAALANVIYPEIIAGRPVIRGFIVNSNE